MFNSVSDDIDIDELFSSTKTSKIDNLKEKVYTIIEEFSQKANGISFGELKSKISLTDEKLRTLLGDLVFTNLKKTYIKVFKNLTLFSKSVFNENIKTLPIFLK